MAFVDGVLLQNAKRQNIIEAINYWPLLPKRVKHDVTDTLFSFKKSLMLFSQVMMEGVKLMPGRDGTEIFTSISAAFF